jgi:hypothetical protein
MIPENRDQVLALIGRVDPDKLTALEREAIRRLYRLDDNRSIEQLVRDGEIYD